MRALATWCVSHRRTVITAWIVGVIVLVAAMAGVGSAYRSSFSLHGTQSAQAQQLLERAAPRASGDREQIVFAVHHGRLTDPALRRRVEATLARVARLSTVADVASPFSSVGRAQIARGGQIAFAGVTMSKIATGFSDAQAERFVRTARAGSGAAFEVQVSGQVAEMADPMNDRGVGIGALAALVVLLVVLGSVFAALLPLITAGFALSVGVSVISLLSHVISMATFSEQLSLLIGLGVGVDYALFIVTRTRQGLQDGLSAPEAVVRSIDTSGRAVMFAGITVCIALLGMFALGVSFLYGVAIAAAVVVAFTVLAALTLLPALLGVLGPRILSRRSRRALGTAGPSSVERPGFWARWAAILNARPAVFAILAFLVIATIAVPFFSLRLGSSDAGSDPSGATTRQAYDLLARGFGPGYNGPLQLVARVDGPGERVAFSRVLTAAGHTPGVARVTPAVILPGHGGSGAVAFADVYPTGSPQAASTSRLLDALRHRVVPGASGGRVQVLIGGQTAVFADFAGVLSNKLPLFIAIVVVLSFLLLAAVFRSLVIPVMAAAMNMLSAGAAFGVLVAVFQWGWADRLLGIDQTGPIEAFIPVMLFAILFGLSMDYEVFLVSRIYEEWHRSGDNRLAVTRGLAATGRVITAAATIMILVFAAFLLGGQVVIKMFGLGLAGAVLMDAVLVRMVLVPSLMLLVGDANWRLPGALGHLIPRLNVEGTSADRAPSTASVRPQHDQVMS